MKFSLNSLCNFINLEEFFNTPDELADRLSSCGFEVEEWIAKQHSHLVVVEIKEKKPHPSADRLSLCQVQSQPGQTHSIVCGATNFQEGDKAVLALPGAILPGPLKIAVRKIRGEVSEGMLVSLDELRLASSEEEKAGILILPKETTAGADFASLIGLNDITFDINITPNRADCLSHFGIARELSCILKRPLQIPQYGEADFESSAKGNSIREQFGLEVRQTKLCSRYTGRAVYGVTVKPSPLWLKVCLENLGLKAINNIVDITNYFLVQWGQPLHAFDLDLLQDKIIVDFSKKGEKFHTLDHQEIQLTGKELCIRDGKEPLALAGVIGGMSSGIHSDTKNIFLESACFEPLHVRKTAKTFNIETDSSYRFSRGVPSESTLEILHKAVGLIQQMAGGKISRDEYDLWEKPVKSKPIEIKKEDLERRLGMEVSFTKFQDWMQGLGCDVQVIEEKMGKKVMEKAKISRPGFRFDLNIKEDLIEEYARLEGYDKIPQKISYLSDFPKIDQKEYTLSARIARVFAHECFYQAINHSFISQKFSDSFLGLNQADLQTPKFSEQEFFGMKEEKINPIFIQNPLSAEYNMMRVSLIPSLFKNAQQSIRHGCLKGRLFEIGKVFTSSKKSDDKLPPLKLDPQTLDSSHNELKRDDSAAAPEKNSKIETCYREYPRLGLVAWGQERSLWENNQERYCVYDLKTVLNTLLESFCIFDYQWMQVESIAEDDELNRDGDGDLTVKQSQSQQSFIPHFIHPYQYMVLKVQDTEVAYIGSLNPVYAETYKVRVDMALAEMNIQLLFDKVFEKKPFQPLSPFPSVERDLSLLIPKNFPAGHIIKGIRTLAGLVCRSVEIFDIYENEKTRKDGVRSVTFRLTLQSDKKTLTEDSLKKLQDKLTKELVSSYPVKLR